MTPRWIRTLPALVVAALLALVLLAPAQRGARAGIAIAPPCDSQLVAHLTNDAFALVSGSGVLQPIDLTSSLQACSLRVNAYYSFDSIRVFAWDPARLAPESDGIPLRADYFDPSRLQYNHLRWDMGLRPIVTNRLSHVAEPGTRHLALDLYTFDYFSNAQYVYYDHTADASLPVARSHVGASATLYPPLPGTHPVLSYGLCSGDDATRNRVIAQAVTKVNASLGAQYYEFAQRFRVPQAVTLDWVELALLSGTTYCWNIDALEDVMIAPAFSSVPPSDEAPVLASAILRRPCTTPTWYSHDEFDTHPLLVPGQDYWLLVRTLNRAELGGRVLTGGETTDFTDGIGALYARTGGGIEPYIPLTDRALDFKLIGTPTSAVGVAPPPVPAATFTLALAPNPARDGVRMSWSGAHGDVRLDVLDARGRRIASATGAGTHAGSWLWDGRTAQGARAPDGLYFVRARDAAGALATERLVLTR